MSFTVQIRWVLVALCCSLNTLNSLSSSATSIAMVGMVNATDKSNNETTYTDVCPKVEELQDETEEVMSHAWNYFQRI